MKFENPNLGDEDGGGFDLAEAATAIVEDESEADNASRADLSMATRSIGHPFQRFGADGTAIIHL